MDHSNSAVLSAAKVVANQFNANVLGIMVGQQTQMIYGRAYAVTDFFNREDAQIDQKMIDAELLFRESFLDYLNAIEWRSTITREPVANYIVDESRAADLIITGFSPHDFYEGPAGFNVGEIVLQSGRPILAIPTSNEEFLLDNILIGWKDTSESRRSIVDALPILKSAKQVTVVEICEEDEVLNATKRLKDVIVWLNHHEISAEYLVSLSAKDDANHFLSIARQRNVNIIVAGAYGHNRFREWVLGGVTNQLLQQTEFACLLSH